MLRTSRQSITFGLLTLGLVVGLGVLAIHQLPAQASTFSIESIGGKIGLGDVDLQHVVINIIRWALGFVTLVALSYMIYGGYLWLTAAGNEQRVEKAKQVILQAAIGLVIILLAWAIVLFAVRTVANVTNPGGSGPGGGCVGGICPPGASSEFSLTAITSCSVPPDYNTDVPLSSAISLSFNRDVQSAAGPGSPSYAVQGDPSDATQPKLKLDYCGDDDTCTNPAPVPLANQVYSGSTPVGQAGQAKNEWTAIYNTITFYHKSFSKVANNADNLYFEPNKFYRLVVPMDTATTAIKDLGGLVLKHCERQPFVPIIGDHCTVDTTNHRITWIFKTGTSFDGPALSVTSTQPSSQYLQAGSTAVPNRNVPRNAPLNINFSSAIDQATVTTGNFQVFKFTTPPNDVTGVGGTTAGSPLDPNDFAIRRSPTGDGMWLQLRQTASCVSNVCSAGSNKGNSCTSDAGCPDPHLFEGFTWYKAVVHDVANLCGTAMTTPYSWVFETNNVTPGIAQVYPTSDHACPVTKVFIQYNTSMWKVGSFSCDPGTSGSFVTNGTLTGNPGRSFVVMDPYDPAHPYTTCRQYGFEPADDAHLLSPGPHTAEVDTNLIINPDGVTTLNKIWNFSVAKPENGCYQKPIITDVIPLQGPAGQCVSVLGQYLTKWVGGAPTNAQGPNDKLKLGAVEQQPPAGAWSDGSIVAKVRASDGTTTLSTKSIYDYQVAVDYGGTIGKLSSDITPVDQFFLDDGADTKGICLYSLNPNQGPGGTQVTATGENFGTYGPNSSVNVSSYIPGWSLQSSSGWGTSQIKGIIVNNDTPLSPPAALISIQRDDSAISNSLPFTVTKPVTGTPQVVISTACNLQSDPQQIPSPNPKAGDTDVCSTAQAYARFTLPMDTSTLNATNIQLYSCSGGTCATPVAHTVDPVGTQAFTLTPTNPLAANTTYQVTITTAVLAAPFSASVTGKPLASDFTWQFTTNSGGPCKIAAVNNAITGFSDNGAVVPPSQYTPNHATARSAIYDFTLSASLVDAACRMITGGSTTYQWNPPTPTTPHVVDYASVSTTNTTDAVNPASPDVGTNKVNVTAVGKTSNDVSLSYNPTSCTASTQCAKNAYGEDCGSGNAASTCVAGQCTPVINDMSPSRTDSPGNYSTVKGCWFGGYVSGQSNVKFHDSSGNLVLADWPDAAVCGAPSQQWKNERITIKIPAAAANGKIQVNRGDIPGLQSAATANSAFDFQLASPPVTHPNLCKLTPTSGPVGAGLTAAGSAFGDKTSVLPTLPTAQNNVTITPITQPASSPVQMSTYTAWTDDGTKASIDTAIPTVLPKTGDVIVRSGGNDSNSKLFTVTGAGTITAATCPFHLTCNADNDVTCTGATIDPITHAPITQPLNCAINIGTTLHCCDVAPQVTSTLPPSGGTNICRNTVVKMTFSTRLDGSKVNSTNIQYLDGINLMHPNYSLMNTAADGTITILPGLLSGGATQSILLNTAGEPPVNLLYNPSFEQPLSTTPGWSHTDATLSSEVPPGHSGSSAWSDCTSGSCATQASVGQNVAGTNTGAKRSFHLTGWVKVENTTNFRNGGLITRCGDSSDCGYDHFAQAPGLFVGKSSGGWKKIDIVVTSKTASPPDLQVTCFADKGVQTWCDDLTLHQVLYGPTGLRSDKGVLAKIIPPYTPYTFTTAGGSAAGAGICSLDHVGVSPADDLFTVLNQPHPLTGPQPGICAGDPALACGIDNDCPSKHCQLLLGPTASAYAANGNAIANIAGVYAWDWSWLSGNAGVVAAVITGGATSDTSEAKTTSVANGQTFVKATATVTANAGKPTDKPVRSGQQNVVVDACDNPWAFDDSTDGLACGAGGQPGTCQSYHFKLSYCRGKAGAALLPSFDYKIIEAQNLQDANRLKSYFFKATNTTQDTIGLLIFDNPDKLSPYDWFSQRFSTAATTTVINGYPAVKTGTTTYIGVTNKEASGQLHGLMFVFDYNSNNATPDTQAIYAQIMSHLIFNTNLNSFDRTAILNDTKRGQDLASIQVALASYRTQHGAYPSLPGGTYVPGSSTSAWPSWQATLGQVLNKSLPTDPANTFSPACPNGYDAQTCWNEPQHLFQCPADSHIYLYQSDGATYHLYGHMEYADPSNGSGTNGTDFRNAKPSSTPYGCFNYQRISP